MLVASVQLGVHVGCGAGNNQMEMQATEEFSIDRLVPLSCSVNHSVARPREDLYRRWHCCSWSLYYALVVRSLSNSKQNQVIQPVNQVSLKE